MKIIKRLGIAVLAVFTITSCSDSFFDVNDSANTPTFSTPELTLPVAQKQTVDLIEGGVASYNSLGNFWTYAWAAGGDFAFFEDETSYSVTSAFRPTTFTSAYLGAMANYDYVEKNVDPKYSNFKAICMIMKAYHFQYLVDAYGDIPYSEAFQRANNPNPKYDDAQEIYNDLIVKLTEAQNIIANPTAETIAVGSKDIMCGGDMAKWAKFANSLKLRILMRQVPKLSPDFSSVNNGIGFLGAGETVYCNPGYIALVSGKQNPFYNAFKTNDAGQTPDSGSATRATPFALNVFDNADTRKPLYWNKVGANYVGIEQNGIGGTPSTGLSSIGPGIFKGPTMDGIIMQSAESLFLQSEAAARGLIAGDAVALYNAGVSEAYAQVGANAGTVTAAGGIYEFPAAGTVNQKADAIWKQKYIALMSTNGFENWCEARRLDKLNGNPIPLAPGVINGPNTPVRLLYPSSEVSTNAGNVPSQTQSDAFSSKIFWDN